MSIPTTTKPKSARDLFPVLEGIIRVFGFTLPRPGLTAGKASFVAPYGPDRYIDVELSFPSDSRIQLSSYVLYRNIRVGELRTERWTVSLSGGNWHYEFFASKCSTSSSSTAYGIANFVQNSLQAVKNPVVEA